LRPCAVSFLLEVIVEHDEAPAPLVTPKSNLGGKGVLDSSPVLQARVDEQAERAAQITAGEVGEAGHVGDLYARVRNRGTQSAAAVAVFAYQSRPSANLSDPQWPQDWVAVNQAGLALSGTIPPGGNEVAGPIPWTAPGTGKVGIFIRVSADGDPSNIDPAPALPCAAGPIATSRLVRWDNNLGLLFLQPVGQ
jgi:hypothetical protein